jgi:hypothetical protein
VRPAVSVGRSTALETQSTNDITYDFGTSSHDDNYNQLFDFPSSSLSNNELYTNGLSAVSDAFDLNMDHMVSHDNSFVDFEYEARINNGGVLDFDDFLSHPDEHQVGSGGNLEVKFESASVEQIASLQSPVGASFNGCDGGGTAVSF